LVEAGGFYEKSIYISGGKMKDGSRNAKILSTCPHNKGTHFVVWTGAQHSSNHPSFFHYIY
jgi:hypothetical protein